jgi:hypothetical protein
MHRLLIFIPLCLSLIGCNRSAAPVSPAPPVTVNQADDSLQSALPVLRQGTDVRHFRDALNLVNAHLIKHEGKIDVHLSDSARAFLKDVAKLNDAELANVDAGTFRPIDAAYLDSCFMFRDAARAIEVADLSALEQARVAFGWMTRRVVLHEQRDEGVPPHMVVMRGFGGPRDRALVFLELLRQFHLEGCVIAWPSKPREPETLLVGVLIPSAKGYELALFDPRLGLPLPGKGQAVANLEAVKAAPDLLAFADIPAGQLDQADARPAYALSALAPRMKFLEEALAGQDRITLYQDAAALHEKLKATGLKIGVWPAEGPPSPRQIASLFFPVELGGVDTTGRLARFATDLTPIGSAVSKLHEMRILFDLPDDASNMLVRGIIADLYTKYYQQPREMLLRGQYDATLARLDRIGDVIDQDRFAQQLDEAQFQQGVAAWRQKMKDAYLAVARQEPGADKRVMQLWAEDQYLLALRDPGGESAPQKFPRKILTHIVLRAAGESLGSMVDYLKAAVWQEKAEKLEAQRRHLEQEGKQRPQVESAAHNAWKNTAGAWDKYLGGTGLGPTQLRQRLSRIAEQRAAEPPLALLALEQLHLDLHQVFEARLERAEALARIAQTKASASLLEQIQADLLALDKEGLGKEVEQLRSVFSAQPPVAKRLELLSRDWTPQGHMHLLRLRVTRMMP